MRVRLGREGYRTRAGLGSLRVWGTSARTARSLLASGAWDWEKMVSLRCAAAPARAVGGATDALVIFQRGRNSAKASGLSMDAPSRRATQACASSRLGHEASAASTRSVAPLVRAQWTSSTCEE